MIADVVRDALGIPNAVTPYIANLPPETRARVAHLLYAIAEDLDAGRYIQARDKRQSLDITLIFFLPDDIARSVYGLPPRRQS